MATVSRGCDLCRVETHHGNKQRLCPCRLASSPQDNEGYGRQQMGGGGAAAGRKRRLGPGGARGTGGSSGAGGGGSSTEAHDGGGGETFEGHIGEEVRACQRGDDAKPTPCLVDVTLSNVEIGLRVVRGRHWRYGRNAWTDDKHDPGTVVGFTNAHGHLEGRNTTAMSKYETFYDFVDGIPFQRGGWCAVHWDATHKESVYPIGAHGPLGKWWDSTEPCFSLKANSHDL
jgi:hypothetical protein